MASTVCDTTLDFGLVSAPIKLKKVAASSSGTKTSLASPDGNPVKQVYVDTETGEIVGTSADCTKGIFDEGGFHEVGRDALATIDEETKIDGMKIDGFFDRDDVPWERVSDAYFIAPVSPGKGKPAAASAIKPLVLLREGLDKFGRVGYGRLTVRTKTYPFIVYAKDGALFVNTLHYAEEFAQAAEAATCLEGVEVDTQMVALAGTLMDQIGGSRDSFDTLADDREAKREELFAKVLAGEEIVVAPKPEKAVQADVSLADLLKSSITAAASEKPAAKSKKKAVAA